jgi:fatty acid desaturase
VRRNATAIADVAEFAHLSDADLEALAVELEAIRWDVEDSRGETDRAYIRRTIALQRFLDVAARLVIAVSTSSKVGWVLGTTALAVAKSIENMELGHNIGHGQMGLDERPRDPLEHLGVGHGGCLVAVAVFPQLPPPCLHQRHRRGRRPGVRCLASQPRSALAAENLLQPLRNMLLAIMFEWGIAMHGLHSEHDRAATDAERSAHTRALIRKVARQAGKDYLFFPALGLRRWRRTLTANLAANLLRNVWAYVVICCGHFADGAEKFTPATLEGETKPEWHLRQMLGTANFRAGPVMAFLQSYDGKHFDASDLVVDLQVHACSNQLSTALTTSVSIWC